MRTEARLSSTPKTARNVAKKGIFSRAAEYVRRVAGILGIAAGTGMAAAAPAPHLPSDGFSGISERPAPTAPTPGNPVTPAANELRDREWKSVVEKGIGAKNFARNAFGTDRWDLLVDEEGNRLSDPSKLRYGRKYFVARDDHDAAAVSSAVKSMGGIDLGGSKAVRPKTTSATVSAPATKLAPDTLISYAEEHLGKPYRLGANGVKAIDCSQLVVESLKSAGIVGPGYDNTAAGFADMSAKKSIRQVQKGDLVFLKKGSHVGHVAIALSAPSKDGYVEILDASSSTGGVSKRKFHVSMAGLSAGTLPFVNVPKIAPDAPAVYAQAKTSKTPAPAVAAAPSENGPIARAAERLASAVGSAVISSAHAEEMPKKSSVSKAVRPTPKLRSVPTVATAASDERAVRAQSPERPAPVLRSVTAETAPVPANDASETASAKAIAFAPRERAETPNVSRSVVERVEATVIDLTAHMKNRSEAESIREKLEKRSLDEQIAHFRAQAQAANDPSFAHEARSTATKLELVKLHGQRSLVSDNVSYYEKQAAAAVPGAKETLAKLNRLAASLDAKISALKSAVGDAQYRKAA